MEFLDLSNPNTYFWLILGIVFILLEISLIPGIGFLFAGIGAMTVGALLTFDMIELSGWLQHIAYFFFFTTVWAVILWKPLKKAQSNKGDAYSNIVGTTAEVQGQLVAGKIGKVKWSGTIMRARISPEANLQVIPDGEMVWVHKNEGGVLSVDVTEPN